MQTGIVQLHVELSEVGLEFTLLSERSPLHVDDHAVLFLGSSDMAVLFHLFQELGCLNLLNISSIGAGACRF